jgi:hypothetical protein
MATKQFYATGTFKYQHRMLTAGEPVEMDGPTSRLYLHLGKIAPTKPRQPRAPAPVVEEAVVIETPAPKPRRTRKKK